MRACVRGLRVCACVLGARKHIHTHSQAKEEEEGANRSRRKELADKLLALESAALLLEEAAVLCVSSVRSGTEGGERVQGTDEADGGEVRRDRAGTLGDVTVLTAGEVIYIQNELNETLRIFADETNCYMKV